MAPPEEPPCALSTIWFPNGSQACIPHPPPEHWSSGLAGHVVAVAVDLKLAEIQRG